MVEELWGFAKKGNSVLVTHISSTKVCISTEEGVEIKSMIDLVLVKRDMLRNVQDEGGEMDETRTLRPPCCTV